MKEKGFENFTPTLAKQILPPRKPKSHKGDFGHLLVLAGSRNLSGAAVLCAWGALRGGAGLVTVATPKSVQSTMLRWLRPEAMTLPLSETSAGSFSVNGIPFLIDWIQKRRITSLALGPGISRHPQTILWVQNLLEKLDRQPTVIRGIVIDADAFLALAPKGTYPSLLNKLSLPIIVTPHVKEISKFCKTTPASIEQNRLLRAQKFAKLYQVVTVLKGHQTISTNGVKSYLNSTGGPELSRGGSGDVLTGLIAALIPQVRKTKFQQTALLEASALGVYLHGLAGEIVKKEKTEFSMLTGELAQAIPKAFKKVFSNQSC